tara:strand:- start:1289 stop:1846 length:558 start_codon:yes stop_codon:yes gene_type:complete
MISLLIRTVISIGIISCFMFSTLNKSDAKETTIGVVEVQLIMQQALAAQSIQTQVEEKRDLYESIVIKEENRLRELEKEILRQKSLLTPDSFAKKKQEFDSQVTAHKRYVRERRRILDQTYADGVRQVQKELASIIAIIAQERGISLVIPASQVLYGEVTLLLTKEALTMLNDKLPRVELNFPED